MKLALLWLCLCAAALADSLVLQSGQMITGTQYRREGEFIIATAEAKSADGKTMSVEKKIPLADVSRVECQLPAVLAETRPLLAGGKVVEALEPISAAVKAAEAYGELPGSVWPELLCWQAQALLAAGQEAEALALCARLKTSHEPRILQLVQATQALLAMRQGKVDSALAAAEPLFQKRLQGTVPAGVVAIAAVTRGMAFLAKEDFSSAMKSFLELPVFLPEETALTTLAKLGEAKAWLGLADYDHAIDALEAIRKERAFSPEAAEAQKLLPDWIRRRQAVRDAKDK